MIQLGFTWPLQRLLHLTVPYGEEISRFYAWDLHCITLHGYSSLLIVHCASRYTCIRYGMNSADWSNITAITMKEIEQSLLDAGIEKSLIKHYVNYSNPIIHTRTHGRREVAFLNRAWEDVIASDYLVDKTQPHQLLLNAAVNQKICRCVQYEGIGTGQSFLERCFSENF